MAITPPSGPSNPAGFKPFAPGSAFRAPRAKSESALSPEAEAAEAEKDSRIRIANAEKNVEDAQRETSYQLDHIRENYDRQSGDEMQRQETSLENQREQGYEAMRELKRQQQAELNKARRDGDKELSSLQTHYRNTTYRTERDGEQRVQEIRAQQARELEHQTRESTDQTDQARETHSQRMQTLKETQEHQFKDLTDSTAKEYERMRENSNLARERAEESFNQSLNQSVGEYQDTLAGIQSRAGRQVNHIRWDTAQKLSAYSSRQSDPFYKLMDTRASLSDDGDEYVLTATIPEHEQQHVSASIKGDQLVISGTRRNEEKLEKGAGHTQGTSSFQSFYESFPLTWPVEGHQLSKEFHGDQLIVRVPKRNEYAYRPHKAEPPEKARVERPKLPENLPGQKAAARRLAEMEQEQDEDSPPRKSPRKGGPLL